MADFATIAEYGFDPDELSGWAGVDEMRAANPVMLADRRVFVEFPGELIEETELRRVTAWDVLEKVGGDAMRWVFERWQEIGDCVSWGGAKAAMATAAYEIVEGREAEKWHPLFEPYLYGTSRCVPEAGNGRLGRSDGSLGSWLAAAIIRYGVLRADFEGVPAYSGQVAKAWGACRGWQEFEREARQHLFEKAAPIANADQLAAAICNGYFCTIAGMRPFPSRLTFRDGKGWYEGGRRVPHQTSFLAYDDGADAFYDSNQWPQHAVGQTDGPDGGGWRTREFVDRELRSGDVECYALSRFNGFPSDRRKPDWRTI